MPGCQGAAPGGLSVDEMRRFARLVAADSCVTMVDLTEIDVECDSDHQRAVCVAALPMLEALADVWRRKS
ncbi:MAG: arginase family protein [Acidimicrobiales bacterium]